MERKKTIISKKLNQMAALLEVMEDLTNTGDCVVHEMSCATALLKGLRIDVAALVENGE
ncbi:hypothetical protein [Vibrio hippocampi]|uniref:Phage protein n=1 Tax=Vibrio hippocampi TaxID=654686 RepID=A0ABN8DNF7_9VIBR|nr:hypothetical protein [Vibrio hippocampi]MBM5036766.1 hypothetical protein [Vibrio parahaemolyticus]MDW1971039.1 hypothetical protein [Vibrio sp. 945]MBM5050401.1 hypothetical protein [Vibrio parahaemolyticus]MBM5077847.1 hypothetical protein [Vibrio parahaemolyticus]MDF5667871.1 hypothetical protein [Vibrio parahaemolyticus]